MEHVMARRSFTQTVKTVSEERKLLEEENKETKTRSRGKEAETGTCELSPTLSALEESQNI